MRQTYSDCLIFPDSDLIIFVPIFWDFLVLKTKTKKLNKFV